ncbi:MAG: cation:proton antiporter [Hyphomicrobiales bacterium]|nr:cation:proton antiporter [Hyphomicrobiales bacterium]
MEQSFHWENYREPLIFLMTAGLVVPLFRRLRMSPVLGFLIAGALLGPSGVGRLAQTWPWLRYLMIGDVEKAAHLAEFGVVFLLFMIGLELSWERLVRMRRLVFGLGAAQVAASTIVLTVFIALWLDMPIGPALLSGAALAMSSTAIVIPVLSERKRLNRAAGRTSFAILLFQDLMVAPLLFVIPLLDSRGAAVSGLQLFWAWAPAVAALFVLVVGGRILLRPLFHLVAAARSTELFVAACLLVVVGASVASAAAGLSMGLGAFVAGLLLAETEFRREIEVTIAPFQGLLLGLFFLTTGAALDIGRIFQAPLTILGVAFGLIAVKAGIIYALARAFRLGAPVAGEVSLLLAPGGEFAFLMIGAAIAAHVMPWVEGVDLMIVVTLTMIAIPFLGAFAAKVTAARPRDEAQFAHLAPGAVVADNRVIVVGFGRVGRLVSELLTRHDIPFIAVDGAAQLVSQAREDGVEIYWGNAARADFLSRVGLSTARALVVTMDAPQAVEEVVTIAHAARPELTIVARARDAEHATHLYELGVTDAIPETIEASLQLAEALLVDIGVPMGFVIASIHEKRDEYRKFLQPHGDRRREKRGIKMSTRVRDMNKPKKQSEAQQIASPPQTEEPQA